MIRIIVYFRTFIGSFIELNLFNFTKYAWVQIQYCDIMSNKGSARMQWDVFSSR